MTRLDLLTAPLSALADIDITAPAFKADPFPFYARLREEAPVLNIRLPRGRRGWLVTRYDDVLAVLKDDARFVKAPENAMTSRQRDGGPRIPDAFKALQRNLLGLDGADHDRLKALVHKAFTPRTVEHMRELTQATTDAALDRAERAGHLDLIADFALPVPLTVIGRILGVPEKDNGRFHAWTRAFVSLGSGASPLLLVPRVLAFMKYLRGLIEARRRVPEDDLISGLVLAQEENDRLTDDEVLAMVFLLLSAGHETTVNLIGSGALALLTHPNQLERLRTEPELVKPAVEELVRYVVPAETGTPRYAAADLTLAGVTIRQGEQVIVALGSANRDPLAFVNPDMLDLAREPNRHLSFGQGMHYCLGAPLSRMEAQIAFSTLLRRAPKVRLTTPADQLRWRRSSTVRGLEALPVTL